jgi:hypothetical protein
MPARQAMRLLTPRSSVVAPVFKSDYNGSDLGANVLFHA